MRSLLLLLPFVVLLPACDLFDFGKDDDDDDDDDDDCETGDSECESDTDTTTTPHGDTVIRSISADCTAEMCRWQLTAEGRIGTVELDLIETGDPSFECGPSSTKELTCGVWSEYHTAFSLIDFDTDTETQAIDLDLVSNFEDQINNQSTLFDEDLIYSTVTGMFTVTDENGDWSDCVTFGHDPSYFSTYCTNVYSR